MPWKAIWHGLREYERYGYLYIQANLILALLLIPVITAPAAYAGMIHMAYTAQTNTYTSLSDFWEGFRAHFGRSLFLGALNGVFFLILSINFFSFTGAQGIGLLLLRSGWAAVTLVWLIVQLYLWPLLEMLEPAPFLPTIRHAFRNAAVMLVKNPLYSAVLLLLTLFWTLFCTALVAPVVMFFFGILATVTVSITRDRLAAERMRF